jgi:SAM-dependent methyltransferase
MASVGVMGTTTDPAAPANLDASGWERLWAPYDEQTYRQVLLWLNPADTVLEIGAGDLRLARLMAAKARRVYAIEINRSLLGGQFPLPHNLTVMGGDAYRLPFPTGITAAVLLMRHCLGFAALFEKLRYVGCRRLITNARWRVGLELISLERSPVPYPAATLGWYACRCGAIGFIPGPPDALTPQIEAAVQEVVDCPACAGRQT